MGGQMSTATENRGGPAPRRTWVQQKHAQHPADPKLAQWADRTLEILERERLPRHILVPSGDPARAKQLKNALYQARNRHNRRLAEDQHISLSANLADPKDGKLGKCHARGVCRCDANGCEPTPGTLAVHARVWWKHEGRAHQGGKPVEQWDYHPGQRRQLPAEPEAAEHAFASAARRPAEPDPGAATPGHFQRPQRAPKPAPKAAAKPAKPDEAESFLGKVRRWTG
jgi:hypothetical protein